MCGIVAIFNVSVPVDTLRQKILRMSQKIRHRGPDWSGANESQNYSFLAILPNNIGEKKFIVHLTTTFYKAQELRIAAAAAAACSSSSVGVKRVSWKFSVR